MEWGLPGDLTAAGAAREHVRSAAPHLPLTPERMADLVLVASELAVNAVSHGDPPHRMRLDVDDRRVRVTISNHGDGTDPQVVDAPSDSGHGRGLAIVASLASRVGWSRQGDRLDVWAEIELSPQ